MQVVNTVGPNLPEFKDQKVTRGESQPPWVSLEGKLKTNEDTGSLVSVGNYIGLEKCFPSPFILPRSKV